MSALDTLLRRGNVPPPVVIDVVDGEVVALQFPNGYRVALDERGGLVDPAPLVRASLCPRPFAARGRKDLGNTGHTPTIDRSDRKHD